MHAVGDGGRGRSSAWVELGEYLAMARWMWWHGFVADHGKGSATTEVREEGKDEEDDDAWWLRAAW